MKKLIALLLLAAPVHAQETYFDYGDDLIPGTLARPDVIDANFQAIETAFANIAGDFFVILWQGDWVTGKEYLVNAFVLESSIVYVCLESHTSGTFATDLAAGKWEAVLSNTIGDNTVTNAKLRDSSALSVIGRASNSIGDPADIVALGDDTVLRRTGGALGFGLVTSNMLSSLSVTTGKLVDDAVDGGKLRDSAALSVIGRNVNSIGNPGDIVAAGNDQLLRRTGDLLGFGLLTSGMFPAAVVPDAALSANVRIGTVAIANGGTGGTTDADARTNLGLAIGSDVQAFDAELSEIAALADTDSNFVVGNGTAWVAENGATARGSLGLGSLATASTINNTDWSGTDLAVANGGTGASTAADARTNLGAAATSHNHSAADITSGTLAVTRGGTGQTTMDNVSEQVTLQWTIQADPGGTPVGAPGDVFAYY